MNKKIVIVGGGFGGMYTLLNLHKLFENSGVQPELILVSKENYFLFTPLLHEVATGSVNQQNIVQPIRQIASGINFKFILGEVVSVNTKNKIVKLKNQELSYDILVLALGSKTEYFGMEKSLFYGLKNLEDARRLKNQIVQCFESASLLEKTSLERKYLLNFCVVGAGPTGVELSAEVAEFCESLLKNFPGITREEIRINLLQRGGHILPQFHKQIQTKAFFVLSKNPQLKIWLNAEIINFTGTELFLKDGRTLQTNTVVLTAGVSPQKIEFDQALKLNSKSQILVNEFLQIPNFPEIFALGDMAEIACEKGSLPQTAQAAEAGAKAVAENIFSLFNDFKLKKFIFKEKGQLVSLGRWLAAAEIFHFRFFGHFAWWIWRTIYASKLIGWANRVRVILDWTIDIFYPRDISKL